MIYTQWTRERAYVHMRIYVILYTKFKSKKNWKLNNSFKSKTNGTPRLQSKTTTESGVYYIILGQRLPIYVILCCNSILFTHDPYLIISNTRVFEYCDTRKVQYTITLNNRHNILCTNEFVLQCFRRIACELYF